MNNHAPTLGHAIAPALYVGSRDVGSFKFSDVRPLPSFMNGQSGIPTSEQKQPHLNDLEKGLHSPVTEECRQQLGEEYWANDGVVPEFSQWHPLSCR